MEDPSRSFAPATRASAPSERAPSGYALPDCGPLNSASQLREDCRLARAARVNLLVIHGEAVLQDLLEWLMLDLQSPIATPVATCRTGEPLVLPPVARARTLILQDVGALTHADQHRLLDWLDRAAGRTQVVSTTPASLWPRIQAGAFIDRLYYRLNTVCMDVTGYLADVSSAGDRAEDHFGRLAGTLTAQSQ
jgi:Sigma-54 interaction domain